MIPRVLIEGIGDVSSEVVFPLTRLSAGGEVSPSAMVVRNLGPIVAEYVTGKRMTVDIGGTVIWAGFLLKATRRFWFDVDKPDTMNRAWMLTLVSVRQLLLKRIVYRKASPKLVAGPVYRSPTYDDDIIDELVTNWLDLSADDLDVSSLVERVAVVNPSSESCTPAGQDFYPWNGGMTWEEALTIISQVPAAIFDMVPGEPLGSSPFARLLYADVETEDAPFVLSDRAGVTGGGGSDTSGVWTDSKAGPGNTITDPPIGTTVIETDFSAFTADGSDPTAFEDFTGDPPGFSGWLKLVLTHPMVLRFNTYDSGMQDTVLIMWKQADPPGPTDVPYDLSDDTGEPGYDDTTWSALPDSPGDPDPVNNAGYNAVGNVKLYDAGTYWLQVSPYDGADWDNSEATVKLSIVREAPSDGNFLDEQFAGTAVGALSGWTFDDFEPGFNPPSTVDVNEGSGHGQIDVHAINPSTPGNELASARMHRVLASSMYDVAEWTITLRAQADWAATGGHYTQYGVWLAGGNNRLEVTYTGGIVFVEYRWPGGGLISTSFVYDNLERIIEVTRASDGTVELRVWLATDPRPGSPDDSDTDDGPISSSVVQLFAYALASTGADVELDVSLDYLTITGTPPPGGEDESGSGVDAAAVGYREATIWEMGHELVNEEFGWGAGKGDSALVFSHRTDAESIEEHGLWQQGDLMYNVWCQDTIEKITDSIVNGSPSSRRGHKKPYDLVELVLDHDGIRVGQKVRFINHEYSYDKVLPVRKSVITFPTPELRRYNLQLSEVVDRWGFEDPPLPFPTYRNPPPPGGGGRGDPPFPPDCACWQNPGAEASLDNFLRVLSGQTGCTSWCKYQWVDDFNIHSTLDLRIDGAWHVSIVDEPGHHHTNVNSYTELPFDPKQSNWNISIKLTGNQWPVCDERNLGNRSTVEFNIYRITPDSDDVDVFTVTVDFDPPGRPLPEDEGDPDFAPKTVLTVKHDGNSGTSTSSDEALFDLVSGGAGLIITLGPTTLAAAVGTLTAFVSYTPTDNVTPSDQIYCGFSMEADLSNDPNEDDPDRCVDPPPDSNANAHVWALRVSSDLGNCIPVAQCT